MERASKREDIDSEYNRFKRYNTAGKCRQTEIRRKG